MNSDLESLKSQWQSLNSSSSKAAPQRHLPIASDDKRLVTAPGKIMAIYRRLLVISLLWIPLSLLLIRILPVWICVTMAAYFGATSLTNNHVYLKAKAINFSSMSVIQALRAVCELQRSRMVCKTIGICLCIPLIITMIYLFAGQSMEMATGGIIGAVLGLVIGLIVDSRIRSEIRIMRSILEDALACE